MYLPMIPDPRWHAKNHVSLTYFTGQNRPPKNWAWIGIFKPAEPHSPRDARCLLVCLRVCVCWVQYDGYTSCPMLVNHNRVMLVEFGYDGSVLETFPVDQRVPRRTMFYITVYIMPLIYWKLLLRLGLCVFFFCAVSPAVFCGCCLDIHLVRTSSSSTSEASFWYWQEKNVIWTYSDRSNNNIQWVVLNADNNLTSNWEKCSWTIPAFTVYFWALRNVNCLNAAVLVTARSTFFL